MQPYIQQYIRDNKGNPIGLLYAERTKDNVVYVSYSLTNRNAGDKFCRKTAVAEAKKKFGMENPAGHGVPSPIKKDYNAFIHRAYLYFGNPAGEDTSLAFTYFGGYDGEAAQKHREKIQQQSLMRRLRNAVLNPNVKNIRIPLSHLEGKRLTVS